MEAPVGRSRKKESKIPRKQHNTPMMGENIVIFFIS